MTPRSLAEPGEVDQFLTDYPDTEFVDAIFIDLCGIARGKRYPSSDLKKLFANGLQIPYSVYLLDVTGDSSDPCGMGFSDGDPDGTAFPLPETLVPVPWSEQTCGQVLMTINDDAGQPSIWDPRNVAAQVVERFAKTGFEPVIAFELEFYLLDRERDSHGLPQPPVGQASGRRDLSTQVYSIPLLDEYAAFFQDVETAARLQKVPCSVASKEFAPGQFEINLRHIGDPLRAADHSALLRYMVQRTAARQGMEATFMAKPYVERTGNGTHVHMSLLDGDGRNVFDDGSALGGETLRHAIGGLAATMAEAMAIFAPSINAYRRFGPNLFVPVTKSWGTNNRSFAFRIPTGPGEARRFEHRIAGADANPYLVLAAILAGVFHGLENKLDPGPPWSGNATESVDPDLPMKLEPALDRLSQAQILPQYIDPKYLEVYCATKRNELDKFMSTISAREYDWYL